MPHINWIFREVPFTWICIKQSCVQELEEEKIFKNNNKNTCDCFQENCLDLPNPAGGNGTSRKTCVVTKTDIQNTFFINAVGVYLVNLLYKKLFSLIELLCFLLLTNTV